MTTLLQTIKTQETIELQKAILNKEQEIIFAHNKIEVLKHTIRQLELEIDELEFNYLHN